MNFLTNLKDFSWLYGLIVLGIVYFCFNLKFVELKNQRDEALSKVNILQTNINEQNEAIMQWKNAAENAVKEQRQKELLAARKLKNAQKETLVTMNKTVIAPGCDNAIKFGIEYAIKSKQK
jgi:hypothetical protein